MLETNDLFQYPQSCTFGVFHDATKTVVVYDTINFFKTLGEILNKLQNDEYDHPGLHEHKQSLTIRVINSHQTLSVRRQQFSSEIETLTNNGYTVLNKRKTLVKYKLRKIMTRFNKQSVICVVKVNSRNEKTVMGIFNNLIEADAFIESLGDLKIIPEIYASNNLTKDYLNSVFNIPLRL
jgi:hypothetical protein